jgi:hypothetical protein
MAKGKRMCPNEACLNYQQPTGMMGGCECGAALVEYYIPPADDQLENFIYVCMREQARRLGMADSNAPAFAAGMAMLNPTVKAQWLAQHRTLQRQANSYASSDQAR